MPQICIADSAVSQRDCTTYCCQTADFYISITEYPSHSLDMIQPTSGLRKRRQILSFYMKRHYYLSKLERGLMTAKSLPQILEFPDTSASCKNHLYLSICIYMLLNIQYSSASGIGSQVFNNTHIKALSHTHGLA